MTLLAAQKTSANLKRDLKAAGGPNNGAKHLEEIELSLGCLVKGVARSVPERTLDEALLKPIRGIRFAQVLDLKVDIES